MNYKVALFDAAGPLPGEILMNKYGTKLIVLAVVIIIVVFSIVLIKTIKKKKVSGSKEDIITKNLSEGNGIDEEKRQDIDETNDT